MLSIIVIACVSATKVWVRSSLCRLLNVVNRMLSIIVIACVSATKVWV